MQLKKDMRDGEMKKKNRWKLQIRVHIEFCKKKESKKKNKPRI